MGLLAQEVWRRRVNTASTLKSASLCGPSGIAKPVCNIPSGLRCPTRMLCRLSEESSIAPSLGRFIQRALVDQNFEVDVVLCWCSEQGPRPTAKSSALFKFNSARPPRTIRQIYWPRAEHEKDDTKLS